MSYNMKMFGLVYSNIKVILDTLTPLLVFLNKCEKTRSAYKKGRR